ncbi:DUF4411 family protein [Carboxydothermus hydrogenoformans]|uniref:PIN domain protein n=1 Tax=Carboxydothermus hydrogenoformans (strain ATCC BAA-161 / DSM 6008 / Z-2901) TaxID=246194 RepID=Q3AFC0_CARHZ|nr:DUF4411 family protein [Carboxydothermus hydrogenoformans]ABB14902.1 PIN domain protein [Carboxydothermus hydrogenoformans Z-2901]
MKHNSSYLLDTNVFVEAARRYYAFDLVPAFWRILIDHAKNGDVLSIDWVKDEIVRNQDELSKWIKTIFHNWCNSTNQPDVINAYREIMEWVNSNDQFLEEAKAEFASGADGWLIAYAKVKGCILVTHEKYNPNIRKKVPIPNVCKAFNVPYIDTFDMMRNLGVKIA